MRKSIKFSSSLFLSFFLYLIFSCSVLGRMPLVMSDDEKRAFIESLAEPSKEKQTFYRWQDVEVRNILIEAKEVTTEIYDYYIKKGGGPNGGGIYIAEDMTSSSPYGKTIIEVEIEPGYRFLDISDKRVLEQLAEKGISREDISKLNPEIAVKDPFDREWWTLKKKKGVKFKPFSGRGISLRTLEESYKVLPPEQKAFFENSIRENVLSRLKKSPEVFKSSLMEVVKDIHGSPDLDNIAYHHRHHIKNLKEGVEWVQHTERYLSHEGITRVVDEIKNLPASSVDEFAEFVRYTRGEYLWGKDLTEIVNKAKLLPITNVDGAVQFLNVADKYLSKSDKSKIIERTPIRYAQDVADFLKGAGQYLSKENKTQVAEKFPIRNIEDAGQLLSRAGKYLSESDISKVVKRARQFPLLSLRDGFDILAGVGDYLSETDKQEIVNITKEFPVTSISDAKLFLLVAGKYLSPSDKNRMVEKTFPFIKTEEELKAFKSDLSDSQYEELFDKLQTKKKALDKKSNVENTDSNTSRKARRLKCLNKQLQLVMP